MKISKKFLRRGLLITVVALIGVLWGLSAAGAQSTQKPPPPPTPQVLENGWEGFTHQEAGYSISFPAGTKFWLNQSDPPNYERLEIYINTEMSKGGGNSISISAYPNEAEESVTDILEMKDHRWISTGENENIKITLEEVSGFDAIKVIGKGKDPGIILAQNNIYEITLRYNMLSGMPPLPEAQELFYEILDTFTIN